MNFIRQMRTHLTRISACDELDVDARQLARRASDLSDESLVATMRELAALVDDAARLQAILAGVAADRSRRESGHAGLAASHGHATPASLIQSITGGTRADATRQVRVGLALLETPQTPPSELDAGDAASGPGDESGGGPCRTRLRDALLAGRLTPGQHDAIRNGLGVPPPSADDEGEDAAVDEAWRVAAEQLIAEASQVGVEELAKRARIVRDLLDPVGAEERLGRRFEQRSFRLWVDADGQHRARIAFDDEMGLWVRSMLDAALRPRRGGPRFIDAAERAGAEKLVEDPRTNEQLEYDLVTDVLRAGSLASIESVFGARQPGVRMLVVHDAVGPRDARGRLLAVGHAEDGGQTLAGSVIDRGLCMHGSTKITTDRRGDPLDVGREQRLYTARQRIALAARDGGCVWPECGRAASYCEAHHCDHFVEHAGRTDIDRGVLLCRFHHMLLHNRGWRITREGHGPFVLLPPPGEGAPRVLTSKAPWRWGWDPPPPPDRPGWRSAPSPERFASP